MNKNQIILRNVRRLSSLTMLAFLLIVNTNMKAQIPGCSTPCNLVINGNFSAGNTGFTSGLTFNCTCLAGTYCVGSTFQSKCALWPATFDHTIGTPIGSYLLIDGHTTVATDVWKETVNVCKGVSYTFSFWGKNVHTGSGAAVAVGIFIDGNQIGSSISVNSQTWQPYSVTWVALSSGPIEIKLRQMSPGNVRDFGIDDIFFGYCPQAIVCRCPPGWLANITNIDGGVTTDGKCKKQLCVWDPVLFPPPSATGTAIGTWGFLWGNGLYVWGTENNQGKAICADPFNCPCPPPPVIYR